MATYPSVPTADFPIKENTFYDIIVTTIPGKETTRARHAIKRRSWELNYHAIHDGESKYLWDFFTARKGNYESFTFIHPITAESVTVRFADSNLERSEIGLNLFDIVVNLVELI